MQSDVLFYLPCHRRYKNNSVKGVGKMKNGLYYLIIESLNEVMKHLKEEVKSSAKTGRE